MKTIQALLIEAFPVTANELYYYNLDKSSFNHTFPTVNALIRAILRFIDDTSSPYYPHQLDIVDSLARKLNRQCTGDLLWFLWSNSHARSSLWTSINTGYAADNDELNKIFGKSRLDVLDFLSSNPNRKCG